MVSGPGGVLDSPGTMVTLDGPSQSWLLAGGTLKAGTINAIHGATVIVTGSGSVLDGVAIDGDLDVSAAYASTTIRNGLVLNGTALIGDPSGQTYAVLYLDGSQTLSGNGTFQFGINRNSVYFHDLLYILGSASVTIGSGVTIAGDVQLSSYSSAVTVLNQGTIVAN